MLPVTASRSRTLRASNCSLRLGSVLRPALSSATERSPLFCVRFCKLRDAVGVASGVETSYLDPQRKRCPGERQEATAVSSETRRKIRQASSQVSTAASLRVTAATAAVAAEADSDHQQPTARLLFGLSCLEIMKAKMLLLTAELLEFHFTVSSLKGIEGL